MTRIFLLFIYFLFVSDYVQAQEQDDITEISSDIEGLSGAEIIIRLQNNVASDEQRLMQLKRRNEAIVKEIDILKNQFNKLDKAHQESDSIDLENLAEQHWQFVRSLLDLHLRSQHAIQQQLTLLVDKIKIQEEIVDYITFGDLPASEDSLRNLTILADTTGNNEHDIKHRKVLDALDELKKVEDELLNSKYNLQLVEQLIRLNREDLGLAGLLAEASKLKIELFENARKNIIAQAPLQLREIRRRLIQDTTQVASLEKRLQSLENIHSPLINVVNEFEKKAENVRARLEFLKSPIAPHRISYWLRFNLPQVAIIIAILFIIWFVFRWAIVQVLDRLKKRKMGLASVERIETLKLASSSIITIIIVFIGILVLLSEVGVDLTVVLGGAAVLSLIIVFGTQSLVKDYFSGFMILIENQYRVGNVVKINKTAGVVENVSLRMTVLRDLEGVVHFIPHGQINEVSNLTHGWSQILFDIPVAYKENVDDVIKILMDLALEIKDDPKFSALIIDTPEMLGVNEFAGSAVIIRFLVKTMPLKQWLVKRELLRRIKNRFDELGIEIPYPHLTVYHHNQDPSNLEDKG